MVFGFSSTPIEGNTPLSVNLPRALWTVVQDTGLLIDTEQRGIRQESGKLRRPVLPERIMMRDHAGAGNKIKTLYDPFGSDIAPLNSAPPSSRMYPWVVIV